MFLFSRPSCPIDAESQAWVDSRMAWLIEKLGMSALRMARVIEPTPEFFPDPYDQSNTAVQSMLDRVCRYMGVVPGRVTLELYSTARSEHVTSQSSPAGLYIREKKEIIAVEISRLADPTVVVAAMAHELAHVRLLGDGLLTGDEEDHEQLTDLATVFFGLGIFNANSAFRFSQWTNGQWAGWKAQRLGYLAEPAFGYALGLWATLRNEPNPRWLKHLTPSPRGFTKQSIRYLKHHPPTNFSP